MRALARRIGSQCLLVHEELRGHLPPITESIVADHFERDLVLLEGPSLNHLAYHFGINPVKAVVKNGKVVKRA